MRKHHVLFGLIFVWACNDKTIATPSPQPARTIRQFFDQTLIKKADILFLVDDSSSMETVQQNVADNFPVFLNVLRTLPGGLPDVRLAVTTSSMGAGAFTSQVPGCMAPDGGRFITSSRAGGASCATARIGGPHPWMGSDGGAIDLFPCIAQVGASGCGFEHQLAAVRAALGDPQMNLPPAPGNEGFLRADAYLAVIWITNEDDCSAPPDSTLFDPSDSSLGPLASFRCTEAGILCGGQPPPNMPAGPLANCTSNENGRLAPVQFFIDYFRRLKPAGRFLPAAVAAPTDPFSIVLDNGNPALAHSCSSGNGTFGDPAVRLKQLIDAFGDVGTFTSICQDSYANAMEVIADKLKVLLGPACLDQRATECTVEEVVNLGSPQQHSLGAVPPCASSGQASGTCFVLQDDPNCPTSNQRVVICRNGYDPTAGCLAGPNTAPDGDYAVVDCATN